MLPPAAVFIDGMHIKASANLKKKIKQETPVAAKRYQEELLAYRTANWDGYREYASPWEEAFQRRR